MARDTELVPPAEEESSLPKAYSQIDYGKVFSAIFQLSNLVG